MFHWVLKMAVANDEVVSCGKGQETHCSISSNVGIEVTSQYSYVRQWDRIQCLLELVVEVVLG